MCDGFAHHPIPKPPREIHDAAFPRRRACPKALQDCATFPATRGFSDSSSASCHSPMANRAVGELLFMYVIRIHQLLAQRQLVGRRLILHVEDLVTRPEELFRFTVTLQAPFHLKA